MAKPSLTNIILFYNMSIGRKELFIKKCNIWLISLEKFLESFVQTIDDNHNLWYDSYRLVLRKLSKPWVVFLLKEVSYERI